MVDCVYCGCGVDAHDPVFVAEGNPSAASAAFCNDGCLHSHIEDAGLAVGTSCAWSSP